MTALYEKDVVELCHLLGQGLDPTWLTSDGGHTSTLLALAIFEIMTLTRMRTRLPKTYVSPGLGPA